MFALLRAHLPGHDARIVGVVGVEEVDAGACGSELVEVLVQLEDLAAIIMQVYRTMAVMPGQADAHTLICTMNGSKKGLSMDTDGRN
jgi:hypothetical protein